MEKDMLTLTNDLYITLNIFEGYFSNGEVIKNNTRNVDYGCINEQFLKTEIERRREHLTETLNKFQSKMNNLDSEINIRYEMQPERYIAKKYVIYSEPAYNSPLSSSHKRLSEEDIIGPLKKVYSYAKYSHTRSFGQALLNFYEVGEVEAKGYHYKVSFDRPGFQLDGYEFMGYVTPYTLGSEENSEELFSDVKLISPYDHDEQLIDFLRKTSGHRKCDGCNRESNRSVYFMFMDEQQNIHYYGRTCAEKIFGISIVEKLSRFIKGLELIGQEFASPTKGGNFTQLEMLGYISTMLYYNVLYGKGKISSDISNIALHFEGVLTTREARVQTGTVEFADNEYFLNYCKSQYNYQLVEVIEYYFKNQETIENMLSLFYEKGSYFFKNVFRADDNEFKQKVRAYGIAAANESDKTLIKASSGVMPYMLRFFFNGVREIEEVGINPNKETPKTHQLEPFSGFKEFDVRILKADKLTAKTGKPYIKYYASTQSLEGIMWYDFKSDSPLPIGTEVRIGGVISKYNPRSGEYTALDQVIIKNSANTDNSSQPDINYTEGDRLKNKELVVSYYNKTYGNGYLQDENGIQFKFYGERFGIEFEPGQVLLVTGTVTNYGGKLALNRCKIQDTGKRVTLQEHVVKLTEQEFKRLLSESVKKILFNMI